MDAAMRFEGTPGYVATGDLKMAVNAAIVLERPLLVKGEPGTGKTVLAREVAADEAVASQDNVSHRASSLVWTGSWAGATSA